MKFIKIFSELSIAKLAVLALVITIGYYVMYFDDGAKIVEQTTQIKTQLDAEKIKRVEIEKKMKKEEEMRGNLLQLARNLDIVKAKIPNEFNEIEISSIANKISLLTKIKILSLKRMTPTGPISRSTLSKQSIGAELIEEVVFEVEMQGPFNGIIEFVEHLSTEEKTIKLRNFAIDKLASAQIEDSFVRFKGEIVGFKQASLEKPTPAAGGK